MFNQTIKNYKLTLLSSLLLVSMFLACSKEGGNQAAPIEEENIEATEVVEKPKKSLKKISLGQRLFIMCQACHNVKEGEEHKVGPNLHGFMGQKAGSKEGFAYSDALKNSGIVWNEEHLRNWLAKPTDYIPGTIMAFIGIPDPAQQTALIEYLKEQTQ